MSREVITFVLLFWVLPGLLLECFAEYLVWKFQNRRLGWMESLKVGIFWPFAAGWMLFIAIRTLRQ